MGEKLARFNVENPIRCCLPIILIPIRSKSELKLKIIFVEQLSRFIFKDLTSEPGYEVYNQ
jgi:hypothetical protein